jgi:serine/threonine-protein kinase
MKIESGTKLGRYEIRSKIGEGGMGEVYLANDTELDRPVAIKVLPGKLAADQQRLQRFIQEAKAASALNHPHILTIYEIGSFGNTRFMASEFIDGETLRAYMRAPRKLTEILEVAIQTASALATAHAAGIIHRDIKPENIMVRRDGYVKVLDFGLAKLTESPAATSDPEAATRAMVNTGAGTVMGTANYMSPEQAKGTQVDARSDIWSLGAVLYEMIAARVPFPGETPTETISLIMLKEPAPVTRFAPEVPGELERIITKTLTKDREERYQTMKDLLIDLRALKRKLEVDAEIDRTVAPELRAGISTSSDISRASTASAVSAPPTAAASASGVSSAEYIASGIKRHKLLVAASVVLIVFGTVLGWWYWHARNTEVAIESIAVLPFANQNGNSNDEWLSDGVTESIINSLTQLPNLKVIARSSVFRYKGKEIDPLTVGKELGVRAVLTGRLTQHGDDLVISAELVDVRDNKQIWGQHYNRKISDTLAVQEDIAREITDKLRVQLTGEERTRMSKRYTDNPEAYQLYLKGRYYWNKRTVDGFRKAIEFFKQALDRDPNYALAYSGLADSYSLLSNYGANPADETMPQARAAAQKALALDDNLAEAHASLAEILHNYDWDFPAEERELKRAVALNPNYATAHQWSAEYLSAMGRSEEAIAEARRAVELDPLSLIINRVYGESFYYARRYDEAIAQFRKTIEIDSSFATAHASLGDACAMKGMYNEAVAEYTKAAELGLGASDARTTAGMREAFAKNGWRGYWQFQLADLTKLRQETGNGYTPPYLIAQACVQLGDKEKAIEWLETGFRERDAFMPMIKVEPMLDGLRSDPRFADLIRRMRFPQ